MNAKNTLDIVSRSAPLLTPYLAQPAVGDYAPAFEAMDASGRTIGLFDDALAGRPIVLVLAGRLDRPDVQAVLAGFADAEAEIAALGANLFVVTEQADAAAILGLARETGLSAPVLGDGSGALLARYGLLRGRDLEAPQTAQVFIITAQGQIHSVMTDTHDAAKAAKSALASLAAGAATQSAAGWIPGHAPILVVPMALEAEDCRLLIEHYEASDGFRVARPGPEEAGDYKFAASDYNRQDRIDHVIRDRDLVARLDRRIQERVIPQVAKAFAFQVTRRETLHIARYRGAREGIAIGHRDNRHPSTQYRRFALSISLNEDYEGGELVFREYAGKGYRGETGTAFVFSSSLLHEVEETTKGTRYNLISHFFNDASVQQAPAR